MLVEEGADGGDRIPDSLQAMIGARIDRLPAGAKIVLQRGSVIGRTFWARRDRPPLARIRLGRARGPARRPAPARPRDPRRAFDDRRRGGVSLQARAHPRGRVRRPVEVRARRIPHALCRVAAREGRQGGDRDPRVSPRPGLPSLCGARRTSSEGACARRAAKALASAGKRALARESNLSARKLLLRSVELEPTLGRGDFSPRAQRGSSEIFRSCATR